MIGEMKGPGGGVNTVSFLIYKETTKFHEMYQAHYAQNLIVK